MTTMVPTERTDPYGPGVTVIRAVDPAPPAKARGYMPVVNHRDAEMIAANDTYAKRVIKDNSSFHVAIIAKLRAPKKK